MNKSVQLSNKKNSEMSVRDLIDNPRWLGRWSALGGGLYLIGISDEATKTLWVCKTRDKLEEEELTINISSYVSWRSLILRAPVVLISMKELSLLVENGNTYTIKNKEELPSSI